MGHNILKLHIYVSNERFHHTPLCEVASSRPDFLRGLSRKSHETTRSIFMGGGDYPQSHPMESHLPELALSPEH
jgi:hypothetical protein